MNRRPSDGSIVPSVNSATGFVTPQESVADFHQQGNAASGQRAPAYTENPYYSQLGNQARSGTYHNRFENNAGQHPDAAYDPEARPRPRASEATERGSVAAVSTTTSKKGFTGSLKSYFRRGSLGSHRSQRAEHKEGEEESKDENGEGSEEKKEPETAEDFAKKMEDPQHLLDTILEEPDDSSSILVPLQDAAATVPNGSIYEGDQGLKQRRQGYRENLMRHRKLKRYTRTSQSIAKMRNAYRKIMSWALVTRVFVWWLPVAIILFIPLAVGAWHNRDMRIGGTRVMWIFIWLEVVWASLWLGKLFAHYMPEVFGFLISIFVPRYFKYVDMVLALELSVQLIICTFISFISFSPILTANADALDKAEYPHQPHWQNIVQEVCVAFLVSAIVFFIEQVFMYLLSTSFHRTRMALRIENQKKSVNVLIILLDMAYSFFPWMSDEFADEDESLQFATLKRATKKVGSAKSKSRVLDKVKNTVSTAAKNVGNMVAEATNGGQARPSVAKLVKNSLTNRETREVLANRIWKSLVMEDSNSLSYEDLITVFGKEKKEEVLYMFDILDSDGKDGIDLDEMVDSVHRIGREAKSISKSLVDMNGAIQKLHYLLMCIALILIVVIFVGMLAPSSGTVLATLGSTLLSMSFLFSATAQEVFQSCVFLFVKHPFDVGDWIQTSVPGVGLVRMQVQELNLMYSTFNQIGINTRRQVSNSVLNAAFIDNISRSPPSQISVVFTIGIPETTPEQLEEFEARLNEFVDLNPRDYAPGVFFQAIDQTDLDRLSLNICINTRNNQADIVLFSTRRTRALEFIGQCIHDIPIAIPHREDVSYHDPSLPVFHYNIKDVDDAMNYVSKTRGKRRPMGMLSPGTPTSEATINDGYVDGPSEKTEEEASRADEANVLRRQPSITSRMSRTSRASRAFSSMSRTSQTFGLRSRGQLRRDTNIPRN